MGLGKGEFESRRVAAERYPMPIILRIRDRQDMRQIRRGHPRIGGRCMAGMRFWVPEKAVYTSRRKGSFPDTNTQASKIRRARRGLDVDARLVKI